MIWHSMISAMTIRDSFFVYCDNNSYSSEISGCCVCVRDARMHAGTLAMNKESSQSDLVEFMPFLLIDGAISLDDVVVLLLNNR